MNKRMKKKYMTNKQKYEFNMSKLAGTSSKQFCKVIHGKDKDICICRNRTGHKPSIYDKLSSEGC